MSNAKRYLTLGLLILATLLFATGCSRDKQEEPAPPPVTSEPLPEPVSEATATQEATTPEAEIAATATPTTPARQISEQDLETSLQVVNDFLARLAAGGFREAYGSYLTTGGQQRLADLVLGRLALSNPHISYFELLGAERSGNRVAVDVTWQEFFEGQGPVGNQEARLLLARQDDTFLIDDIELAEYRPAATPVPPPMPQSLALTNPALPGEAISFRASGFEVGETVLSWLEAPDGELSQLDFQIADAEGAFELSYPGEVTAGLEAGRWIWWAQALRDSTRNTGITFQVMPAPTPTPAPPTPTPRPQPTRAAAVATAPAPPPEPSVNYGPPTLLFPEVQTSRNYNSALIVDFVPVADQLGPDEFYELVLLVANESGVVYGGASVRGKGDPCSGRQYDQPCISLTLLERETRPLHPDGGTGRGRWFVQVVKQTGPDEFTPISPPSEERRVDLNSR